jgi:hypothetical protein
VGLDDSFGDREAQPNSAVIGFLAARIFRKWQLLGGNSGPADDPKYFLPDALAHTVIRPERVV